MTIATLPQLVGRLSGDLEGTRALAASVRGKCVAVRHGIQRGVPLSQRLLVRPDPGLADNGDQLRPVRHHQNGNYLLNESFIIPGDL